MRRREFITVLGGAAAWHWPLAARAQQPAIPIIGYLDSRSPEAVENRLRGFRQGLKDAGYIEGENVTILYRWADDRVERLPLLAAELVSRSVAAIFTAGAPSALAAKAATTTIPIIFAVGNDPVQMGLATSLSRPSGNLTGIDVFTSQIVAKRLEVLRDLFPKATRMGAEGRINLGTSVRIVNLDLQSHRTSGSIYFLQLVIRGTCIGWINDYRNGSRSP